MGDTVRAGHPIASIEAMKMEAAITAPVDGVIERLAISETQQVDAGDLWSSSALPSNLEGGTRPKSPSLSWRTPQ
nr:hypothetical protein GCM10025699_24050 [Microbacterium flavescens]